MATITFYVNIAYFNLYSKILRPQQNAFKVSAQEILIFKLFFFIWKKINYLNGYQLLNKFIVLEPIVLQSGQYGLHIFQEILNSYH